MGLFLLGVLRPRVMEQEARALSLVRRGGLLGAFPLGLVFAAGWTPCIGPTLAAILTLTAADGSASPARGATSAFAYALGLGLPFIVIGGLLDRDVGALARLRKHSLRLEHAGGAVLVLVGVLLVTGLCDRVLVALHPAQRRVTSEVAETATWATVRHEMSRSGCNQQRLPRVRNQ